MKIRTLAAAAVLGATASMASFAAPGPITLTDGSGSFSNTVGSGSFTDSFTFTLGTAASDLMASVITFASSTRNINFSSITLSGPSLASTSFLHSQSDPAPEVWELGLSGPLLSGLYTLNLAGTNLGSRSASYSGTLEITPVPEPSTVGMLLAGLGVVGFIARRRRPQQF